MSLAEVQAQRQAVAVVHEIVGAMRAMAAGRVQSAQRALDGARQYHEVVVRAMGTLSLEGAPPSIGVDQGGTGLLVLTSEQALCGVFNVNVLAVAERRLDELRQVGEAHLFVVGRVGRRKLAARGIEAEESQPAATSVRGLRDQVKRLAALLANRYTVGRLTALHVVYSRYQSVSQQVPVEEQILPLGSDAVHPVSGQDGAYHRYLQPSALLAGLIEEYIFISLYRVAAESYASEQASRLVAMDAATRNTADLLDELVARERHERQKEITRQVLELSGTSRVARS